MRRAAISKDREGTNEDAGGSFGVTAYCAAEDLDASPKLLLWSSAGWRAMSGAPRRLVKDYKGYHDPGPASKAYVSRRYLLGTV